MMDSINLSIRQWWLGQLSDTDAIRVEEALFADADVADAMDDVRCDVLDDFVAHRLTADEDRHVAALCASDRGRRQLGVAQALHARHVRQRSMARRRFAARVGAVAATLILAVTAAWFGTREGINRLPTLSLRAISQRAAEPVDVTLPPNDGKVRLQTEVTDADGSRRYRVLIADRGVTVFESKSLSVRRVDTVGFVETAVPAATLAPGPHRIIVREEDKAEVYSWEVNVRAR